MPGFTETVHGEVLIGASVSALAHLDAIPHYVKADISVRPRTTIEPIAPITAMEHAIISGIAEE